MDAISIPPVGNLIIGYSVSVILGWVTIEPIMTYIRKRSEVNKPKSYIKKDLYLVRFLGVLERFAYTTCIIFGQPAGIAAWLAVKVLTRWSSEREKEGWESISKANIYLIGNLLTVLFGAGGGLLCILLPK